MPKYDIQATIYTVQTIEAETMEEAKVVAMMLDDWDFMHDWEEFSVGRIEVIQQD